jgi:hypothetical protein
LIVVNRLIAFSTQEGSLCLWISVENLSKASDIHNFPDY